MGLVFRVGDFARASKEKATGRQDTESGCLEPLKPEERVGPQTP